MTHSWDLVKQTINQTMILVPHRGESDYRQWRDWFLAGLQKPPGTGFLEIRGLSLTTSRTKLVMEALKTTAQYFFFLDDDLIGPDDALLTMLGYQLPIVSGLYMAKKRKEERGLAAWMKVQDDPPGYLPIDPKQNGRFAQVDVIGLGCCLLHRSIFERLSQPWFEWKVDGVSEDFYLFDKVSSELGIKPMLDMELGFSHIGTFLLDTDGSFTTLEK